MTEWPDLDDCRFSAATLGPHGEPVGVPATANLRTAVVVGQPRQDARPEPSVSFLRVQDHLTRARDEIHQAMCELGHVADAVAEQQRKAGLKTGGEG